MGEGPQWPEIKPNINVHESRTVTQSWSGCLPARSEAFSEKGKGDFNHCLEPVIDIPDPLQPITQGIQEADAGTESLNHALFREPATWEVGEQAS